MRLLQLVASAFIALTLGAEANAYTEYDSPVLPRRQLWSRDPEHLSETAQYALFGRDPTVHALQARIARPEADTLVYELAAPYLQRRSPAGRYNRRSSPISRRGGVLSKPLPNEHPIGTKPTPKPKPKPQNTGPSSQQGGSPKPGSQKPKEEGSSTQTVEEAIGKVTLSPAQKELIEEVLKRGKKLSADKVLNVWKVASTQHIPGLQSDIIWIEEGNKNAGMKHMLAHKDEFGSKGIPPNKLSEVAQAATSVGTHAGHQGQVSEKGSRVILILSFHDKPLAVAISVGSNGFVVGMNPRTYSEVKPKGFKDEDLNKWPTA